MYKRYKQLQKAGKTWESRKRDEALHKQHAFFASLGISSSPISTDDMTAEERWDFEQDCYDACGE